MKLREFIRAHGGDPQTLNGYGLSECGAANTLATFGEVDHGIGRPLEGVSVRIRDEETGEFHAIDGVPHVGTLYLSSPTNSSGRLGEQVLFELEQIEGASYVCTNDLVRTNEAGDLFFVGRANRLFVNNEGVTFDTGVVENALAEQAGIAECAIVGAYEKVLLHDTIPALYARVERGAGDEADAMPMAEGHILPLADGTDATAGYSPSWQSPQMAYSGPRRPDRWGEACQTTSEHR